MPLKAQTAKFDSAKNATEQPSMVPAVPSAPRHWRVAMPAKAGRVMAT